MYSPISLRQVNKIIVVLSLAADTESGLIDAPLMLAKIVQKLPQFDQPPPQLCKIIKGLAKT